MNQLATYEKNTKAPLKLNFIEREKINKLKENLLCKIVRDLNNKYKQLITDKKLEITSLSKSLTKLIDEFYDFNNTNYNHFFSHKVEKFFLAKVSEIEDKKFLNLPNRNEIQKLLGKNNPNVNEFYGYIPQGRFRRTKEKNKVK